MRKIEKRSIIVIISTIILILAIIDMFIVYRSKNSKQIAKISETYIENVTVQSAGWLDDILGNASLSIYNMAVMYGNSLKSTTVDKNDLYNMAERSMFDYVNFVNKDGINMTANGDMADVSDRHYFIAGIKGETGLDGAYTSLINGNRMIVFYAPVEYKGEIIGVLTGHYLEDRIKEIMKTKLFDEDVTSFLCLSDGQLIASMGNKMNNRNIADYLEGVVDESELEDIKEAFSSGDKHTFVCNTQAGQTYGCISDKMMNEWRLVQLFPAKAMSGLKTDADSAGMSLQFSLLCLFAVYMGLLMFMEIYHRIKITKEKNEVERILEGVNRLFSHFILLDLEHDTYRYMNGLSSEFEGIPDEGTYSEFRELLRDRFMDGTGDKQMYEVMQDEYINENLGKEPYMERFEYKIVRNGEEIWQDTAAIVLEKKNDKPVTILLAIQEITGAKNKELESQRALREAYQMARMANHSKSEFLSRMSHDIRTPMNGIMGMVTIANWNLDDKDKLKDCLSKINVSGQHLLGLIDEVLDMSKIESGKLELQREKFNILEFMKEIADIAYSQVQSRDQHFSFTLGGIVHENVIGDFRRLSQVLVNIVGNAVKFTPNGGDISIYMNELPSNTARNGCYEIVVTDNGIGMDEEFIGKIFEPFARASDSRTSKIEGSGLGMSIARNIVNMMNGDIQVKSKKGEGTQMKVTVFLEYISQEEENLGVLAGHSVILIDADKGTCDNVSEMLLAVNMTCDCFDSLEDACKALKEKEYSAILAEETFFENEKVGNIRKKSKRKLPLIVLSDYDWHIGDGKIIGLEVDSFLEKSLLSHNLIPVLRRLLDDRKESAVDTSEILSKPKEEFKGKKVLLVEDYDLNIEIGTEILSRAGFEVDVAMNGKEAVDRTLDAEPGTYCVILMDIQMPVMNGYEATVNIRKSGRRDLETIPIIAMTANAFMDDIQKGTEAGMNGHISKPINIDKLMDILERNIVR